MKFRMLLLLAALCIALAMCQPAKWNIKDATPTTETSYGERPTRPTIQPMDLVTMIRSSQLLANADVTSSEYSSKEPDEAYIATSYDNIIDTSDSEKTLTRFDTGSAKSDTESTNFDTTTEFYKGLIKIDDSTTMESIEIPDQTQTTSNPNLTPISATPTEEKETSTKTSMPNSPGYPEFTDLKSIFGNQLVCHSASKPTETTEYEEDSVTSSFEVEKDNFIPPQTNPKRIEYVDHSFYKSALVCHKDYFKKHWTNITNAANRVIVHPILNNVAFRQGYRDFSLQIRLPFDFPFYGHRLENITISTGGYIFTGTNGHFWHAQEQNISPLMGSFDISLSNNSAVVLFAEASRVTIVWENMKVREKKKLKFTFAVTLHKNGDIHFAYKDLPIRIQDIDDKNTVFVGIADSYYLSVMNQNSRRKILHNYSRIPFNAYDIMEDCVLHLVALPSCPIYNTCKACTGHANKYGTFKCKWCDPLRKCTSGADFYRPYMADCTFSKNCDSIDEDETSPHLSFFHRIFNYAM